MKTQRQLEMIYLLLKDRQQTAEKLANHFDVSTKTILRDVETLSAAGIPIKTQQGVKGGIVLDDRYALNKSKLSTSEVEALLKALDNLKKLPNAQLEYALKMMKQFFNEAATMWVNTDDVSLDIQDKFHLVKRAVIEKNVIEFRYFTNGEFLDYRVEPYELRIGGDVWKVLVRDVREAKFEELFLARMADFEVRSQRFTRRELPDEFGKRYAGVGEEVCFVVEELTERILDRFPVEGFDFSGEQVLLKLTVKGKEDLAGILECYGELKMC